jgi:hypothetical protein
LKDQPKKENLVKTVFVVLLPHYSVKEEEVTIFFESSSAFLENSIISEIMCLHKISTGNLK